MLYHSVRDIMYISISLRNLKPNPGLSRSKATRLHSSCKQKPNLGPGLKDHWLRYHQTQYWPERKPRTKISLGFLSVTAISRKKMEKDQAVSFLIPMRGYAYPRLHAAHFVNCFTGILMIMICYGNLFHHVIIQVHHEMSSQNVFKRGFWTKDFVSQIPGTHVHHATTIWSKYHWRIVKVICCFLYSDYFPVWLGCNMSLDGCWIARLLTSRLDLWKKSDVGWSWWKREVHLFLLTFALWLLDARGGKEHPQYYQYAFLSNLYSPLILPPAACQ